MQLPPLKDTGNIEYKLHIKSKNKLGLIKLSALLKIRCNKGRGMAIYLIGVDDHGKIVGINSKDFKKTIDNLIKMVNINKGMILQKTINQLGDSKLWATVFILDYDFNKDGISTTTYTFKNNRCAANENLS